jgi:SAM-dependent methyltransferase
MSAGDPGYLTDVEYTGNFYQFLAPAWLAYIASINGYVPPRTDRPYAWCELGCGRGVTALLLAATHPCGAFHGCDLNPAHIAYAEELRRAAGVANAAFLHRSFREMLVADLPPFDFIVLHGVYSWVPEPVRAEIREFLARKLKPGGLVMVSYNAMPGWAALQPLRRLMAAHAAAHPGDSLDKARAAFARVKALAEAGAGYFAAVPAAKAHLQEMERQDIRYVAHEYLTPHGDPFYFSEVESALRAAGLVFAGSMTPADNYPELMMPARLHALIPAASTRSALETHRDFILNTTFRQDLYAAQPRTAQPAELPLRHLEGMAFCLTDLPERLPARRSDGPLCFDLHGRWEAVRAVHALLQRGAAGAREIREAASAAGEEDAALLLQQLVVSQHIAPCPPVRVASGWPAVNSAVVEAGIRDRLTQVPLACPASGSASTGEVVHAAVIEAAARCADAEGAARSVLGRLRAHGHPVNRYFGSGEKSPATDEEISEYVAATWRTLHDARDPGARLLRLFGVLS